jgi:hypothetical protein
LLRRRDDLGAERTGVIVSLEADEGGFVSNRMKEQAGWQIQAAMRCSNCFY